MGVQYRMPSTILLSSIQFSLSSPAHDVEQQQGQRLITGRTHQEPPRISVSCGQLNKALPEIQLRKQIGSSDLGLPSRQIQGDDQAMSDVRATKSILAAMRDMSVRVAWRAGRKRGARDRLSLVQRITRRR
jgi:hypothetical protein